MFSEVVSDRVVGSSLTKAGRVLIAVIALTQLSSCGARAESVGRLNVDLSRKVAALRSHTFAASVEACMKREGFKYRATVVPKTKLIRVLIGEPIRYKTEYGVVDTVEVFQSAKDPNGDYLRTLNEAERESFQRALTGGPDRKQVPCLTGAIQSSQATAPDKNIALAVARFDNDQSVRRYRATWAKCMGSLGHNFPNRNAMVEFLLNEFGEQRTKGTSLDQLRSLEKATVSDDRSCINDEEERKFQSIADDTLIATNALIK
jgi:hypothetical protein